MLRLLGLTLPGSYQLSNSLLFKGSLLAADFGIRIYLGEQIAIALQQACCSGAESDVIRQARENGRVGQIRILYDLPAAGRISRSPALQFHKKPRICVQH